MLPRPYLMTLHVIFPIHLKISIRSKCVSKAIIHRKNSGLFYGYWRTKTFVSGDFYVVLNVVLWKSCFPGWSFLVFYGLHQKSFSFSQPWWWLLINSSLIFQFCENVSSFNFLANALHFWVPWVKKHTQGNI